jgi:hypothetical protein
MLIVKGTRVRLHMAEGGPLVRPRGGMMHDPTGKAWPRNSILLGPFKKEGLPVDASKYQGAPKEYLGRNYNPKEGSVNLPPKALSHWEDVGLVERIDYYRHGTKAPGGYTHKFHAPRGVYHVLHAVKGKRRVMLRRCGKFYRLDLGKGAIADDRGIVFP